MCGIVGLVAKTTTGMSYHQQELFEEMLVCDSVRGDDSTGVFGVNKTGNVTYLKLASHPFNLLKTSEYISWKQDSWQTGRIAVGHNRKASSGAISNENAHPFAFGPVVLVHNGLVDNFRSLVHHKERTKHNVDVDSHAIALLFARNDPMKVIPEIRGAFVFVWYNASEKKLYMVRNTERPLSLVECDDGIYFCSEKGMLRWLLRRRANNVEIGDFKPGILLSLDENNVWENRSVNVFEKPPIVVPTEYERRPSITVDQDGVMHLPVQQSETRRIPKLIEMKPSESFNIFYGNDEKVELDAKMPWPQIVFSVDDYKMVSDEKIDPPVWKLWGKALDSDTIEVACQFRGTEDECNELAYADYIIGHVSRVAEKLINNKLGQIVYCLYPKKCEVVTTANDMSITIEHLNYLHTQTKCTCGHVEVSTLETEDRVLMRLGFETTITCKWCLANTPECTKVCGSQAGTCDYCVAEKEKEQHEAAKAAAV